MARERREAGMATAELAMVIPAMLLVLAMALTGLALAADQVRCVDAARAAARATSRGDDPAEVRQIAEDLTPSGTSVAISTGSDTALVTVTAPRRMSMLPGLPQASATAEAALEPGAAEGGG